MARAPTTSTSTTRMFQVLLLLVTNPEPKSVQVNPGVEADMGGAYSSTTSTKSVNTQSIIIIATGRRLSHTRYARW